MHGTSKLKSGFALLAHSNLMKNSKTKGNFYAIQQKAFFFKSTYFCSKAHCCLVFMFTTPYLLQ